MNADTAFDFSILNIPPFQDSEWLCKDAHYRVVCEAKKLDVPKVPTVNKQSTTAPTTLTRGSYEVTDYNDILNLLIMEAKNNWTFVN